MSEFERQIWEKLTTLEKEVEQLKSERSAADQAIEFERLPGSAVVGVEYVAYRFGCSLRAAGRRENEIKAIPLASKRPLGWIKSEVDAAWDKKNKPVSEKAADARAKAKPIRRRSIIKNQVSA